MKDVKITKEFDISTPEGLNIYHLVNKLPLIMQAMSNFKEIVSRPYPLNEFPPIKEDEEIKISNFDNAAFEENNKLKIEIEKIKEHNAEYSARNIERQELLSLLEKMLKNHGVIF